MVLEYARRHILRHSGGGIGPAQMLPEDMYNGYLFGFGENLFKDIKKAEEREGPSKGEQLTVQKRNGRLEPFSDKKMARSLAGLEPHS